METMLVYFYSKYNYQLIYKLLNFIKLKYCWNYVNLYLTLVLWSININITILFWI